MPLKWRLLLLALALVAALFLFAGRVDLRDVWLTMRQAEPRRLAWASGALFAGLLLHALRWRWLLGGLPFTTVFLAAAIGHAANSLVPLRAGEAARAAALNTATALPAGRVLSSILVERLLDLILRLAAVGAALALGFGLPVSARLAASLAAFVLVSLGILFWLRGNAGLVLRRLPRWLARLPRVDQAAARRWLGQAFRGLDDAAAPSRLAPAVLASLLAWLCFGIFYEQVAAALPAPIEAGQRLALSLGALAIMPPSAPAAPGIFHAALVLPLAVLGLDAGLLAAFAALSHGLLLAQVLPLGLAGLLFLRASPRQLLLPRLEE